MVTQRSKDEDQVIDEPTFDDGAFENEGEEFLDDAETFVDDNQHDYYRYGDKMHSVRADIPAAAPTGTRGKHSRPATKQQHMDAHQKKSRRTRVMLWIVSLLLLGCLAGLGYLGWQLLQESRDAALQQSSQAATEAAQTAETKEAAQESGTTEVKKTEIPQLVPVMGSTLEEALDKIGHGAAVTVETAVNEDGNPVKKKQTVILTKEPADTKSGAPTVYLGENADGKVVMTGYSAATTSLGYGDASFRDAVTNDFIVEKTLRALGLDVKDGTAKLPEKEKYSTYSEDEKTLVKEQCTFEGEAKDENGESYTWSAVLQYNYTAANASGNLGDTVRTIFVYIDKK